MGRAANHQIRLLIQGPIQLGLEYLWRWCLLCSRPTGRTALPQPSSWHVWVRLMVTSFCPPVGEDIRENAPTSRRQLWLAAPSTTVVVGAPGGKTDLWGFWSHKTFSYLSLGIRTSQHFKETAVIHLNQCSVYFDHNDMMQQVPVCFKTKQCSHQACDIYPASSIASLTQHRR